VVGLWYFLSRLAQDLRSREKVLRETSGKLLNANEQLKQLDVFKNRFLHQVVTKLKGPTVEMDFDLSEVEKSVPKEKGDALVPIQIAKKRAWILLELIEDLSWLSRVDAEDIPFKKEWVDVHGALTERIQAMEGQALQKGIAFQLNGEPNTRLWADREAFDRVAVNLFSNAVKYTPAGEHKVTVEFKTEGEWLILSVQDEGIGIPPKQQSKLFQEFFRATNAKTMEKFGTGLGLSIVKRIMDWHGGKVQFAEISKQGAKVETWWPFTRGEPEHSLK
jgi:two-component system sensor histidine kinase VicK